VQSSGAYSDSTVLHPLINNSQMVCTRAVDSIPPCSAIVTVEAVCPRGFVRISWEDVRKNRCGADAVDYALFFKPTIYDNYVQVSSGLKNSFIYDGLDLISGCYAVQVTDSSGNKSRMSDDFCIDNCPEFELPNIFTPNGDGMNDDFKAIKVRQIKEIDLVVNDRWGNLVYKTKDPYFKWNGVSNLTKSPVSEGTFFFVCDVYEPRVTGTVKRTLKGFVEVAR
jgi:gliding motility-associated-like protein